MREWIKSNLSDLRILLIVLFIITSTGHVGKLFADREAKSLWFLGYLLAFAIDGTLAIALYQFTNAKDRQKWIALAVFLAACFISGGFNITYYRLNYPSDHWLVSAGLGIAAFGLAAAVAVLKAIEDTERAEREDELEIRKFEFEVLQKEETKRVREQEKTKRLELETKQSKGSLQSKPKGLTTQQRRKAIYNLLLQNIDQSVADLAKQFGVTAQTIRNDLKVLAKEGKITYKDGRISLRPQKVVAEAQQ